MEHSDCIVQELKQRLAETRMHQESFSKTFNLLLQLFNTLNSVTHVEELVSTKVGVSVTLCEPVNQLMDCLREESLEIFYEKVKIKQIVTVQRIVNVVICPYVTSKLILKLYLILISKTC